MCNSQVSANYLALFWKALKSARFNSDKLVAINFVIQCRSFYCLSV